MELNPTPIRLLILVLCIAAFGYWGGFAQPQTGGRYTPRNSGTMMAAWGRCVLLFLTGAVCVSLVDHRVGLLDPINLRLLYVLLGLFLMGGSVLWIHALKQAVEAAP